MGVEWDPHKADINLQKHGVRFSDAEAVLFDPNALSFEDTTAQGEQRFVVIGMDHLLRLLVVIYTDRDNSVRLISARPATRSERYKYESGI
ncbi:MAG: BrnT family toxin [Kovacikia sp.]